MPFVLIILGLILFVTAIKGTTGQLASLFASDTFGQGGYLYWLVAILIVGAVGYIKPLKTLSDSFVVLLLIVLFLANGKPGANGGGFFKQFQAALGQLGSTAAQAGQSPTGGVSGTPVATATPTANPLSSGGIFSGNNGPVFGYNGPSGTGYVDSGAFTI